MEFNTDKLKVNFIDPMTPTYFIENRKYTLTHSDTTGMLFLDVANFYNYDVINFKIRDDVLGEWIKSRNHCYTLCLYVYLKGIDIVEISKKYKIFKENLELAITAILYGDIALLTKYKYLMNSPIYVNFSSAHFMYNSVEYYKTPKYHLSKYI